MEMGYVLNTVQMFNCGTNYKFPLTRHEKATADEKGTYILQTTTSTFRVDLRVGGCFFRDIISRLVKEASLLYIEFLWLLNRQIDWINGKILELLLKEPQRLELGSRCLNV